MIPSRVLGSGMNSMTSYAIGGVGQTSLTATGSTSTDALALTSDFNEFGTVASGTGASLPGCEMGAQVMVVNDGANALTLYPDSSSTIDGSASYSLASGKRAFFIGFTNTEWFSFLGA